MTPSEESALVAALERDSSSSVLFDRHFYIFDLVLREEAVNFEWVNMVREPVARLVSMFHYLRCKSPVIDNVLKGAISVGGRELENHLVSGF